MQAELREKELRDTSVYEQLRKKELLEETLRKQLAEMEQQLKNLRGKIQERNEQLRGVTQQMCHLLFQFSHQPVIISLLLIFLPHLSTVTFCNKCFKFLSISHRFQLFGEDSTSVLEKIGINSKIKYLPHLVIL